MALKKWEFGTPMGEQIEEQNANIADIDANITEIDTKITDIDANITKIDANITEQNSNIDEIESKLADTRVRNVGGIDKSVTPDNQSKEWSVMSGQGCPEESGTWFYINTLTSADDRKLQLAYKAASNLNYYMRTQFNGTWSPWVKLGGV